MSRYFNSGKRVCQNEEFWGGVHHTEKVITIASDGFRSSQGPAIWTSWKCWIYLQWPPVDKHFMGENMGKSWSIRFFLLVPCGSSFSPNDSCGSSMWYPNWNQMDPDGSSWYQWLPSHPSQRAHFCISITKSLRPGDSLASEHLPIEIGTPKSTALSGKYLIYPSLHIIIVQLELQFVPFENCETLWNYHDMTIISLFKLPWFWCIYTYLHTQIPGENPWWPFFGNDLLRLKPPEDWRVDAWACRTCIGRSTLGKKVYRFVDFHCINCYLNLFGGLP